MKRKQRFLPFFLPCDWPINHRWDFCSHFLEIACSSVLPMSMHYFSFHFSLFPNKGEQKYLTNGKIALQPGVTNMGKKRKSSWLLDEFPNLFKEHVSKEAQRYFFHAWNRTNSNYQFWFSARTYPNLCIQSFVFHEATMIYYALWGSGIWKERSRNTVEFHESSRKWRWLNPGWHMLVVKASERHSFPEIEKWKHGFVFLMLV